MIYDCIYNTIHFISSVMYSFCCSIKIIIYSAHYLRFSPQCYINSCDGGVVEAFQCNYFYGTFVCLNYKSVLESDFASFNLQW